MRAKYKIGTLIEVNTTKGVFYRKIDAIIIDKDGVSYGLECSDVDPVDDVREENVLAAYRPVVVRQRKQAKKAATRAKAQPAQQEIRA